MYNIKNPHTLSQIFHAISDPCYNGEWITPYSLRAFLRINYSQVYQLISRIHIINNQGRSPTSRVSLIEFLTYFSSKDIYIYKWENIFVKCKLLPDNKTHVYIEEESMSDASDDYTIDNNNENTGCTMDYNMENEDMENEDMENEDMENKDIIMENKDIIMENEDMENKDIIMENEDIIMENKDIMQNVISNSKCFMFPFNTKRSI